MRSPLTVTSATARSIAKTPSNSTCETLDAFFHSFPTFEYDPSQPPATSYARLRAHEGWQRGKAASTDAWDRYQDALEGELRLWYGE
jgi:hypothetical protein